MSKSIAADKSFIYTVNIIKYIKTLTSDEINDVLIKQLIRCSTSIGANLEEGQGAFSRKDFLYKNSIAYKETRESIYWLKLLVTINDTDPSQTKALFELGDEIKRIIGSIIITSRRNLAKSKLDK